MSRQVKVYFVGEKDYVVGFIDHNDDWDIADFLSDPDSVYTFRDSVSKNVLYLPSRNITSIEEVGAE